jgi:hypothetical protein
MIQVTGISYGTPGTFYTLTDEDCLEGTVKAISKIDWDRNKTLDYRVDGIWTETWYWVDRVRFEEVSRDNYNEPHENSIIYWLCHHTTGSWYQYYESQKEKEKLSGILNGKLNTIRPVILFENKQDALTFKLTRTFRLEPDQY